MKVFEIILKIVPDLFDLISILSEFETKLAVSAF